MLLVVSGLPMAGETEPGVVPAPAPIERHATWQVGVSAASPMTTTDPQHVGVSLDVARLGTSRVGLQYQPSKTGPLGFVQATLGLRLLSSDRLTVAADFETSQVWATRVLFQTPGFQFERHERRWLNLGVLSFKAHDRRWLGLIDGIELGAGRMFIRDMAAGRDLTKDRGEEPVLILKSAATVGMLGLNLSRPLFLGLGGQVHVRVIGGGRSKGGEVPFAHVTAEWEVSKTFGPATLGLTGIHASNARAVTYFQNGVGVVFRAAF
jgi:hypothetical protein